MQAQQKPSFDSLKLRQFAQMLDKKIDEKRTKVMFDDAQETAKGNGLGMIDTLALYFTPGPNHSN